MVLVKGVVSPRVCAWGFFRVPGQVIMPAGEWLNTADAARVAGVQPVTIRQWRRRGYLAPQGLDEHNRPVHTREAVQAAERLVREQGLQATAGKVDPRRTRRPAAQGISPRSPRCPDCGYLVSAEGHLRTCIQPGPANQRDQTAA